MFRNQPASLHDVDDFLILNQSQYNQLKFAYKKNLWESQTEHYIYPHYF